MFRVHGRSAPYQGGVPRSQGGTPTSEYEGQAPAGALAHDAQHYMLEGSSSDGRLVTDSGDAGLDVDSDDDGGGLAVESLHRSAPGMWEVSASCLICALSCAALSDLLCLEDHQQD